MSRIAAALSDGRVYLLRQGFTTVDILVASPFQKSTDLIPDEASIRAWVDRVAGQPPVRGAATADAAEAGGGGTG
ncbi:hypothetical protein [Jannaschia rubra]|uniref:GST C-terminal domain-containing protein n=1 Tax=Jannaschia rubra TaxID=282197 RepID=A0A0M6XNY4_9RHOB|nr:hypothetical protein [Jannaschia rubra]CTQ32799.1 hypothetical protein JAN5088_01571 [Jannaschia rubra]SFF89697.1 hypothetical protein SAMN04488517_101735 [Jannaschia rubra]